MILTTDYSIMNATLSNNEFSLSTASEFSNESECSDRLPSTKNLLKNVSDVDFGLGVTCLVMTILLVLLYAEEVAMLKRTYTDKEERLKVMCLLGIYPVFSSCAVCGLIVPRSFPMTEFLSTFYLSMAMFIFQRMIVLFMTGEGNLVRVFNGSHLPLAVPPLCCICPCIFKFVRIKVTAKSIIAVRLFVLQGALIRPILSFFYGVYFLNTSYPSSDMLLVTTVNILKGLSMMLAMFGLQIIYRLTRGHLQKDLGQHRILAKFGCFQLVIIFGIVQPNIINILQMNHIPGCNPPYGSKVLSLRYNNMVTIFEMFAIAIIARYVYHQKQDDFPPGQDEPNVIGNQTTNCYAAENPALDISIDSLSQEDRVGKNLEDKT